MGREAVAVCHWKGDVAEVKLHLDSKALQLRGVVRDDIPRSAIKDAIRIDEGLRVLTDGPELFMEFGEKDAERWRKALLKKPPTLAEKFGISPQTPAFVCGPLDDDELVKALDGATVSNPKDSAILVAVLMSQDALKAASDLALAYPGKHIWMVHQKGKAAIVGDTAVRTHMRALGFIDSKASAVSEQLTSTRYRLRTD